jgi:hypothetical protein
MSNNINGQSNHSTNATIPLERSSGSWLNKLKSEIYNHPTTTPSHLINDNNLNTKDRTTKLLHSNLSRMLMERSSSFKTRDDKATLFSKWWRQSRFRISMSQLYKSLRRFNPIMHTFEVLIYTFESVGFFSIAQLLSDLRRLVLVIFRFIWSFLFLFDPDRRLEKSMRSIDMEPDANYIYGPYNSYYYYSRAHPPYSPYSEIARPYDYPYDSSYRDV